MIVLILAMIIEVDTLFKHFSMVIFLVLIVNNNIIEQLGNQMNAGRVLAAAVAPLKGGRVVTQQYVLILSVSVKYVLSTYLCYSISTYLRGLAVQLYRLFTLRDLAVQVSLISTSLNVVLPRVIQHLIFNTHIYIS